MTIEIVKGLFILLSIITFFGGLGLMIYLIQKAQYRMVKQLDEEHEKRMAEIRGFK